MNKSIVGFMSVLLLCGLVILLRPRVSIAQGGGGAPADLISQITITRPTYQATQVLESREERVNLATHESISVEIELSAGSGPVYLLAPHGGSINDGGGKLEVQTTAQDRSIDFTFQPGTANGSYTVEVSDGQRTETLALWTGPEPPRGAPGPALTFPGN